MKKLLFVIFAIATLLPVAAEEPVDTMANRRQEWKREMRENKHNYLARHLELTDEQRDKFFKIYDETDAEIAALNKQVREIERRVADNKDATEADYNEAIEEMFTLRQREGEIEKNALERYREVLTPQQLFKLKSAERQYTRALFNHHRNSRVNNNAAKKRR